MTTTTTTLDSCVPLLVEECHYDDDFFSGRTLGVRVRGPAAEAAYPLAEFGVSVDRSHSAVSQTRRQHTWANSNWTTRQDRPFSLTFLDLIAAAL